MPRLFSIGHIPWNKGKKLNYKHGMLGKHHTKAIRLKISLSKKGKVPQDSKSWLWKGKNVGYRALHDWVQKHLGKAKECCICEKVSDRIHWANMSHEYKRELDDWIELCAKCHKAYDIGKKVLAN